MRGHQRRGGPPRPLRHARRAARRVRARCSNDPATTRRERRRPRRAASSARRVGATAVGSDSTLRRSSWATCASSAPPRASRSHDDRGALEVRVGAPGPPQRRRTRRSPPRVALVRGVEPDAVVDGARALRRGAAALRVPRRGRTARRSSTTTRTCPARSPPSSPTARGGRVASRSSRSSSPTATPGPRRSPRSFAGAFDGVDVVVVTDVYAAGEPPLPGVTGPARRRRDRRGAPPRPRSRYVKDRARARRGAWRSLLGEGDLVLTMGAGDLTTLARRAAGGGGVTALDDARGAARRARAARRAARCAHDLPRRRHRGAPRRGARRWRTSSAVAARSPAATVDVLVVGRGSNLLVADARLRRPRARRSAGEFESIDDRSPRTPTAPSRCAPAARSRCRCSRARCADQGLAGLEWAVGVPGSVGGAVRMNAGGHGDDTASSLALGRGVRPAQRRRVERARRRGRSGSPTGARTWRAHEVVTAATFAVARGRPAPRPASAIAEIVRWRREHQPGGANAGSVFRTRPATTPARLDRGGGREGTPARHRDGLGEARELHPGRSRRPRRRRRRADRRGARASSRATRASTLATEVVFVGFEECR